MRLGLRAKMLGWFGGLLLPIIALLAYVAATTASVRAGFAEARAVDELAHAVQQVLQWTTDYSLTWRPESLRTAEQWAARYRETSRRLREQGGWGSALDRLDAGFDAYWAVAGKMADGYINFDRVVGNSFTGAFHAQSKTLEDTAGAMKDEVSRRMQATLTRATQLAVAAAVLIVAIVSASALLISSRLVRRIRAVVASLQEIATGEGDLTKRLEVTSADEIGEVGRWFNTFTDKLHDIVAQVGAGAANVATAAHQLSAGSTRMAEGAQAQAASLEQTAASLEELTATVKQAADNAAEASRLALGSRDTADRGGSVVVAAIGSMEEITRASRKIAEIITVIDEIAFQTNLLALNAAVEAARAGQQGRGFAVVAAEVRNLAQRSAAAAREINGLIQDSVTKIKDGSALVNQSGHTLQEIVASVKRAADIIAEMAAASHEQSQGIDQVNRTVSQMGRVTQANAAQTDQVSATAGVLSLQAAELRALVGRFKLHTSAAAVPAPIPGADRPAPTRPVRRAAPQPVLAAPGATTTLEEI